MECTIDGGTPRVEDFGVAESTDYVAIRPSLTYSGLPSGKHVVSCRVRGGAETRVIIGSVMVSDAGAF